MALLTPLTLLVTLASYSTNMSHYLTKSLHCLKLAILTFDEFQKFVGDYGRQIFSADFRRRRKFRRIRIFGCGVESLYAQAYIQRTTHIMQFRVYLLLA